MSALVAHIHKSKLKRLFLKIMSSKREEEYAKVLLALGDSSFLPIQFPAVHLKHHPLPFSFLLCPPFILASFGIRDKEQSIYA